MHPMLKSSSYFLLLLAFALLTATSCKKKCEAPDDLKESGIIISDNLACLYVRSEELFEVQYALPVGEDTGEEFDYAYTASGGFTIVEQGTGGNAWIIAAESGVGSICLTVTSDCGESSNTVCIDVTAIDTDLIFYQIRHSGEPDRDQNLHLADGAAFAYDGFGYSVGGYTYALSNPDLPIFKFDPSPEAESWTEIGRTPNTYDFTSPMAVVTDQTVVIFGMEHIWHLNMSDLSFTEGPAYPNAENGGTAFVAEHNGLIYFSPILSGGQTEHDLMSYDPSTMSIQTLSPWPVAAPPGVFAQPFGNRILIGGGGYGGLNNAGWSPQPYYWYDIAADTWTQSMATTKGTSAQRNTPLTYFEQSGITYLLTADNLHTYDEAAADFVLLEKRDPSWPTCFTPELLYQADPRSVTAIVLEEKVVLSGYARPELGGPVIGTHIIRIKP